MVAVTVAREAGPVPGGPLGRSVGPGPGASLPSYLEALDVRRWAGLSSVERVQGLQRLEDHMAGLQGRAVRPVVLDLGLGDRSYGRFDGRLCLNPGLVGEGSSPYRAVQTVLHEGRHAFQRDAVGGMSTPGVPGAVVQSWRDNYQPGAYNDHNPDDPASVPYHDYRFQPLEDDAHRFAAGVMESVSTYFAHDPGYRQFLTTEAVETARYEQRTAEVRGADFREKIAAEVSARAGRSRQQVQEVRQGRAGQARWSSVSFPVPAGQAVAGGWQQADPAVRRGGRPAGRGPSRGGQER